MCMHKLHPLQALRAPPGILTLHGGIQCAIEATARWSQALLGTL